MLEKIADKAGKKDEYVEMKYKKTVKRNKVERDFGEIKNVDEFEQRCLNYGKTCGIGLLPAAQSTESEKDSFEGHIDILSDLDNSAK